MANSILNEKEALERIFDKELLKELLVEFSEMKELDWAEFDRHIAEGNAVAMELISHSIKGVSGNLSLAGIYHAATELNNIVALNDKSLILQKYDVLKQEVERFREFLSEFLRS